jgi:hypothetical protein
MKLKSIVFICFLFYFAQDGFTQVTETRSFSSFNKIKLCGAGKVFLTEGSKEEATITAQNLNLSDIITEIKNNTLHIYPQKNVFGEDSHLTIYLTYKQLDGIQISGAVDLQVNSVITSNKFDLKCSGSEKVSMKINTKELFVKSSGSGKVNVSGNTHSQSIELSGSGKFTGYELSSHSALVNLSGSGKVELTVNQSLVANVSGSGNISYKGTPAVKDVNVNGSGHIDSVN